MLHVKIMPNYPWGEFRLCLEDRGEIRVRVRFHLGWTCIQKESLTRGRGELNPGVKFIPGWNHKCSVPLKITIGLFKAAAADMRYFARSKFSRSLVHKKKFSLIWQSVFQVRILILSREVGYLFWIWINSENIARDNYSR